MQHSPCNYALINYIPFDMLIFTVPKNKQLILLVYTNILRKNDTKRENEDIKNKCNNNFIVSGGVASCEK